MSRGGFFFSLVFTAGVPIGISLPTMVTPRKQSHEGQSSDGEPTSTDHCAFTAPIPVLKAAGIVSVEEMPDEGIRDTEKHGEKAQNISKPSLDTLHLKIIAYYFYWSDTLSLPRLGSGYSVRSWQNGHAARRSSHPKLWRSISELDC